MKMPFLNKIIMSSKPLIIQLIDKNKKYNNYKGKLINCNRTKLITTN